MSHEENVSRRMTPLDRRGFLGIGAAALAAAIAEGFPAEKKAVPPRWIKDVEAGRTGKQKA